MALLQKKPFVGTNLPLYTIGSSKTVLIVGLGNPDKKYAKTRHNVGFMALESFATTNDFPKWIDKKDLKSLLAVHTLGGTRVILCRPTTYMNLSGEAAKAVQHFFKVHNGQTLAVYDELAIPFGQLRTRTGGSDAGHNGVKSLVEHLGEDFCRLRIGIGSEIAQKKASTDFVLSNFSKAEQSDLPQMLREANSMITEFIFSGQLPHETRKVL